jgi:hypothetical protein
MLKVITVSGRSAWAAAAGGAAAAAAPPCSDASPAKISAVSRGEQAPRPNARSASPKCD